MKKLLIIALALGMVGCTVAENPFAPGETPDYANVRLSHEGSAGDVVLQAFAWQSKWSGNHGDWYNNVKNVANIDKFDIIWFPPPGKTIRYDIGERGDYNSACGYMPMDYRDYGSYRQWVQDSSGWYQHGGSETLYGSTSELQSAISTLHGKGCKVIADVVVNHRAARQKNYDNEWCSWKDSSGQVASGYMAWGHADYDRNPVQILNCSGGGGGNEGSWSYGGRTYYNTSTGYAAEISHWYSSTRNDIKAYLYDLKNYLGFDGFRWDLVKGFEPSYVGEYNDYVNAYFSVGEWYEYNSRQALCDWVNKTGGKSMVFDFDLKGDLTMAVKSQNFSGLAGGIHWWPAAMVTFVDNHDTGKSSGGGQAHNPIEDGSNDHRNRMQAYAYILSHPGTPCVYWYHWQDCGSTLRSFINTMIDKRKQESITKTSSLSVNYASGQYYEAVVGSPGTGKAIAIALGGGSWRPWNTHGSGWTEVWSSDRLMVWTKN